MASWCPPIRLVLDDHEATDLRELLSQTAAPGSLQSRLIPRIDAAVDEAKRPRPGRPDFRNPLLQGGH